MSLAKRKRDTVKSIFTEVETKKKGATKPRTSDGQVLLLLIPLRWPTGGTQGEPKRQRELVSTTTRQKEKRITNFDETSSHRFAILGRRHLEKGREVEGSGDG